MLDIIDPGFDRIECDDDRSEAWTRAVSTVVQPTLAPNVPVSRTARFHSWRLGGLILNEIVAPAQVFERTPVQIASQGVDHVLLSVFTSGRTVLVTPEGERSIPVGSVGLFDLSQKTQSRSSGMSGLNVIVPRRCLDPRLGEVADLHQSVVSPRGRPLVRLLADQIRTTHACITQVDAAQKRLLADGITAALNAAFTPVKSAPRNAPPIKAIEIRRFIEANLGRSDLGVDALCAQFGLSRTPVYEYFETDGGVMTYIRNRRLAWAMRMLSGVEGGRQRRISEIAYVCGFDTLKAFSKSFKARYGVVPRDVDASYLDDTGWEAGTTLQSWMKAL